MVFCLVAAATAPASAQATPQVAEDSSISVADRPLATRAELEARLETLQSRMSGQAARDTSTARRLEKIRERLRTGDFRVGDLVQLQVRGDQSLSGTFSVNRQRQLELPTLPPVDLDGVIYSEVEAALEEALSEYLRNPNIRAQALWRVAVVGGVGEPGFYDLSPSATLSDAMMQAGGPTQRADLDEVEFRRQGTNLLEGWDRPIETLTLAELEAQRGDQLFVPQEGSGMGFVGVLGLISGLSGTVWAITRLF